MSGTKVGLRMDTPLSANEREALCRFVAGVINDVQKVITLFEARGADATLPRAAMQNLEITLKNLKTVERLEFQLQAQVPDNF